eukprot:1126386-Prymnesium_polylepis.3
MATASVVTLWSTRWSRSAASAAPSVSHSSSTARCSPEARGRGACQTPARATRAPGTTRPYIPRACPPTNGLLRRRLCSPRTKSASRLRRRARCGCSAWTRPLGRVSRGSW